MIRDNERRRVIFGCGNFGGIGSAPALSGKGDPLDQAFRLLDRARDCGITRFDTANTYGGGESEIMLGQWLRRQGATFRAAAEIATKVGNPHGCPIGERPLSRTQVAFHLDRSLQHLGIERIDLYYLHAFDALTPLDETFAALDDARRAGKITRIGISNATVLDFDKSIALSPIAAVQNEFNFLQTRDLKDVIPRVVGEGSEYVAFSPLAGGLLTGKYGAAQRATPGSRLAEAPAFFEGYMTPENRAKIAALEQQAKAENIPMSAAALRFVLNTPGIGALLIAPRQSEHFDSYGLKSSGQE